MTQEAVGLQQLVGQVVDERADLVAVGVRGHLGVELVEQRVRDGERQLRTTSRFAGTKPWAAAKRGPPGPSRSSNRYDGPLITCVRPRARDVLDEPLEQRTADAAAAEPGLDGGEHERLVEVVLQRQPDDAPADHPVPVEDPERVGPLTRRRLPQGDRHLLEGLEGVPGAAVLHLGAPADLVEPAQLGVVVDVDRAGLHAAEP